MIEYFLEYSFFFDFLIKKKQKKTTSMSLNRRSGNKQAVFVAE